MKNITHILSFAASAVLICSCASEKKMVQMAEDIIVKCSPTPLEMKGGWITADLAVTYPKNYFNPKALLEVTPVVVYGTSEEKMQSIMYQGDKVIDNYRVISSAGSTITQKVKFQFREGMEVCHLELRASCSIDGGKKWVALPVKKVADGCNITETLAGTGYYSFKDHNYQPIIMLTPEGQFLYQVNSSDVRAKELENKSIKEFLDAINEIYWNDRERIRSIDVVAYASPEGTQEFNNRLSMDRSKTARGAFDKVTKDEELDGVRTSVKSIGEDWEGFQEMVAKSKIEDKDLILRVLSMYKDPRVREKEIRNMSSIFQDISKDVLPQLRRARFIANVEYTNFNDEELRKLIRENVDILDEESLLKAASLVNDPAEKITLYSKAVEKFSSDRAKYNIACVKIGTGDVDGARQQLKLCDAEDPDVINLMGVCEMRDHKWAKAKNFFFKADNADAAKNIGLLYILDGDYVTAIIQCKGQGPDAAIASLLHGDYPKALECIEGDESPIACYVRAIVLNRQGETAKAREELSKATSANPALAARSLKDIEFANLK